jgi:hypothetical protein
MSRLIIETSDDENSEEYFCIDMLGRKKYLTSTNHDEDGYAGMRKVREALKALARSTGMGLEEK